MFYLSHGWQKIQRFYSFCETPLVKEWPIVTIPQRWVWGDFPPRWGGENLVGRVRWHNGPCWMTNLKDEECSRANSSKNDYLKSENLHLSLSLTFVISMTSFCVERWRLGVTDSETHRWMSIRTDPNIPFMAAAVAWNGKLHPWLNTDGRFQEHCSWVEFLVPFVRDMLRAQHFFLVHSEGHCKLELIPCCVAQSLQSRNDETDFLEIVL